MHIDFDYFFAQCEELRNPEIKSHPVVICVFSGRTEESGVVSTANYLARQYGVKSGIPIRVAKSKLKEARQAVFLHLDIEYYKKISERAMSVIRGEVDVFERVGIDECFADVSQATEADFDRAYDVAHHLKEEVKRMAQISCSVGVAPNKILAKIASDFEKPDGLTIVRPEEAEEFVSSLDVERIPGIGRKTRDRLVHLGVDTVADLAAFDIYRLTREFGKKTATYMHNAAKGLDDTPVEESEGEHKQIMRVVTLKQDTTSAEEMEDQLEDMCGSIHANATKKNIAFKNVGIILILSNLETISRSKTLKSHSSSLKVLVSTAKTILEEAVIRGIKVRRLGVRISDFRDNAGQESLFDFMAH